MTTLKTAWVDLESMVERGFAVAFRKDGRRFRVRAVREERILEGDADTMAEAMVNVYQRAKTPRVRAKG